MLHLGSEFLLASTEIVKKTGEFSTHSCETILFEPVLFEQFQVKQTFNFEIVIRIGLIRRVLVHCLLCFV